MNKDTLVYHESMSDTPSWWHKFLQIATKMRFAQHRVVFTKTYDSQLFQEITEPLEQVNIKFLAWSFKYRQMGLSTGMLLVITPTRL